MTQKERLDAIIELKDMAYEHERRAADMDGDDYNRGRRMDRAKMLRNVVEELCMLNDMTAETRDR